MKDEAGARALAGTMVEIGTRAGVATEAVITRMDAPLGRSVGNAVEIAECVSLLQNAGPPELTALVVALASRMVRLAGRASTDAAAEAVVLEALRSGRGLETLRAMIERQGGDPGVVDDPARLPAARHRALVRAPRAGWVTTLDAWRVGRSAAALGAGRERMDDVIDRGAGILVQAGIGARVAEGEAVLELRCNDGARLEPALALAREALGIGDAAPSAAPLVLGTVAAQASS
jgi:thymidine phosphorylase